MSMEDYKYKRKAISAAKDFGYSKHVIMQLKAAQTEADICRIMRTAREREM